MLHLRQCHVLAAGERTRAGFSSVLSKSVWLTISARYLKKNNLRLQKVSQSAEQSAQQILGRVKGALPARRPPASQIRLQGRNLPAVDVLWRHPWRHRSAPLPASADFSVPGRCAQDSGIPKQRGGGSHNSSPAGSSPDPSLRLVCRVYAELCKLILEIPRASVRWFL